MTAPSDPTLGPAVEQESSARRVDPSRGDSKQLSAATVGLIVVAAVLADVSLRAGVAALASTITAAVIVGPLLSEHLRRSGLAVVLGASAVGFAAMLPLRASTWLTWLNGAAVVALLGAAVLVSTEIPRRFDTSMIRAAVRGGFDARLGVPLLARSAVPRGRAARWLPLARGVALAVIPLVVLTSLLASADAVFAETITPDFAADSLVAHGVLTTLAAVAIAGLLAVAHRSGTTDEASAPWRPLGAIEATTVLGAVTVLYSAFAAVQLYSALGRADAILNEQGVTYAEYARSGFFQLLWVAALTALLLAVVALLVSSRGGPVERTARALGATVALLTVVIVAVAIVRLGLYTDEFGQTTLRWYSTAFAWMLGAGFVLGAAGHLRSLQARLPRALLALIVITLVAVNVLNPEARVAAHNLDRDDAAEALDVEYLLGLSADAWPELLDHRALIEAHLTEPGVGGDRELVAACRRADRSGGYGPFGFNLARARLTCID